MIGAVPLWLHILAATVWVGSQIMMFVVVVPSLRLASDQPSRQAILTGVTRRFGYLGFAALVLLLLTGIDNIDRYAPGSMFDFRYGYILSAKLAMFGLVVLLTGVHTLMVGPRLLQLQSNSASGGGAELRSLRMWSILISVATLVLSIAILFCAALLRSRFAFG